MLQGCHGSEILFSIYLVGKQKRRSFHCPSQFFLNTIIANCSAFATILRIHRQGRSTRVANNLISARITTTTAENHVGSESVSAALARLICNFL
jgi:hypothetical protein